MTPTICLTIDWYLPGTNSGGPVRSVANLVAAMPDTKFCIITRNTDYCSEQPYAGIQPNIWVQTDKNVEVCYLEESQITKQRIKALIVESGAQSLYISGVYSKAFSQWPVLIGKALKLKTVVAARGMLSPHSLAVKSIKKYLFVNLMRWFNAFSHVQFHATSEQESVDIKRILGATTKVKVVSNLGRSRTILPQSIQKEKGSLLLVSIGRISPEKGTLIGLKSLQGLNGTVTLNIFGTSNNADYWLDCENLIKTLPPNILVHYNGSCSSDEVADKLVAAHALLLPSEGENYGHAIVESLGNGRPVIISKHTPWQNLEQRKAGWDLNFDCLTATIQQLIDMDQADYQTWMNGAHEFYLIEVEKERENIIYAYQNLLNK